MKKIINNLILICLICAFLPVIPASAEDDFQLWTTVTASGKFDPTSKFYWYLEGQPRIGDDAHYIERLLIRGAAGYELSPNLIAWLGYGWTPLYMNSNYEHDFQNETRIFEQVTYDQKFDKFSLSHRARLEEREIDGVSTTAVRFRYLLRGSLPLIKLEGSSLIGLSAYDEYFYNLNSTSPKIASGPDRNRLFAGPYWKNDFVRVDLGYLLETSERIDKSDRHIHALATYVSFNF